MSPPLVSAADPVWPPGWPALTDSVEPLCGSGSPSAPDGGSESAALPGSYAGRPSPCTLHLAPQAAAPDVRLFVQSL